VSRCKEAWWDDLDGSGLPLPDEFVTDEPQFIAMTRTIPEHLELEIEWLYEVERGVPTRNEGEWVRTFLVQPPSHRLSGVIRSLDARVAA
jgi:hypothetical protein